MTVRGVALTKYPCIVEACLEGGGGVTIFLDIPYELANIGIFFSKYPTSLAVTKLLNTVSHYGISVKVKLIVYPISQEEKWQISCIPKTHIHALRRADRKTDRQTHFSSLHLHMLGD